MALLLASFGSSNLVEEKEDEENKIVEAIDRIKRFLHILIGYIFPSHHQKKSSPNNIYIEINTSEPETKNQVC